MPSIITIHDKGTGELVGETRVEARHRGTKGQAMISWRGIAKIADGDSMGAAVQAVFDKFSRLAVFSQYDIRLMPDGGD